MVKKIKEVFVENLPTSLISFSEYGGGSRVQEYLVMNDLGCWNFAFSHFDLFVNLSGGVLLAGRGVLVLDGF